MRAFRHALCTLTCLSFALAMAGCGQDFKRRIECKLDSDCLSAANNGVPLFRDGSASVQAPPACCGGFCVLPASGCDSGYRYLDNDPGYGECVEDPMCPVPPDMAMPAERDMSVPPRG